MDQVKYVQSYQQAWSLWKENKLVEAKKVLMNFWAEYSMQSLRGMLLMAYILRDEKRYISEVRILQDLLSRFQSSDDKILLADAWSVLGSALRMLGESELSLQAFLKAVEIEPGLEQKIVECSNALFTANAIADISAKKMQNLYLIYRNLLTDLHVDIYPVPTWKHQKIRVGYMSADLHMHAVAQFIHSMFCAYNKKIFEVYVYQLNEKDDEITKRFKGGAAIWKCVYGFSWKELSCQIRSDEIDVLVDLSGHTAGGALPVFAWKVAPIQLSGIGYFNSTGLYETCGFISDLYCAPSQESPYFTEQLLRLPQSHFCYQPFNQFPSISLPPCLKNGYVTFGCFNNFSKVNDDMLKIWKKIMDKIPSSRLILKHSLLGTDEGCAYTLKRFQRLGLPLERIELRGLSDDYLYQYRDIDIALDTSPYNGGLTTCEALYMGVPVVTLIGNRHGSRFGYSFLSNIGLDELAGKNESEYVEIAVELGHDFDLLKNLHQKLRGILMDSPLMDVDLYMKNLEDLYILLYKKENYINVRG